MSKSKIVIRDADRAEIIEAFKNAKTHLERLKVHLKYDPDNKEIKKFIAAEEKRLAKKNG